MLDTACTVHTAGLHSSSAGEYAYIPHGRRTFADVNLLTRHEHAQKMINETAQGDGLFPWSNTLVNATSPLAGRINASPDLLRPRGAASPLTAGMSRSSSMDTLQRTNQFGVPQPMTDTFLYNLASPLVTSPSLRPRRRARPSESPTRRLFGSLACSPAKELASSTALESPPALPSRVGLREGIVPVVHDKRSRSPESSGQPAPRDATASSPLLESAPGDELLFTVPAPSELARPRVDLNAVTFTSGQGRTTSQQGRDVRMWCGARTDRSLGTDRLVRRFEGGFGVY